jgi:hypothetical protein
MTFFDAFYHCIMTATSRRCQLSRTCGGGGGGGGGGGCVRACLCRVAISLKLARQWRRRRAYVCWLAISRKLQWWRACLCLVPAIAHGR